MSYTDEQLRQVTVNRSGRPMDTVGAALGRAHQNTVKLSNVALCNQCGVRRANSMLNTMCGVCYRKQQIELLPDEQKELLVQETVPELYHGARLSHTKPALAERLHLADRGVFLYGVPGVGKSYAMAAFAREQILEGFTVVMIGYELLCLQLRDTFKPCSSKTEWDVISQLVNADKLFIEDVGASRQGNSPETDFSVRTLQVLLDTRMIHCKPTYVTSNKTPEEMSRTFDERIGSRLKALTILKLDGEDRRG